MTILTSDEGATMLRTDVDDQVLADLLPLVDAYLLQATGHKWEADTTIDPLAKNAARMLLVQWYENPGMMGDSSSPLSFGLRAAVIQLKTKAMELVP